MEDKLPVHKCNVHPFLTLQPRPQGSGGMADRPALQQAVSEAPCGQAGVQCPQAGDVDGEGVEGPGQLQPRPAHELRRVGRQGGCQGG